MACQFDPDSRPDFAMIVSELMPVIDALNYGRVRCVKYERQRPSPRQLAS